MVIVVDMGHTLSGADYGAVGILKESICTREIGYKLKEELEALGHTVILTNVDYATDVNNSLQTRVNKANTQYADLFISLHLNSGGGTGFETLIHARGGQAEVYAKKVQALVKDIGYRDRGVRVAKDYLGYNLYVLSNTKAPAALIECGFVDSQEDADNYNPDRIAKMIAAAITGQEVSVDTPKEVPKMEVQAQIKDNGGDYMSKIYQNGSTRENVYADYNLNIKVGSLDEYENCEAIADLGNRMVVLYNTPNGKKAGFVAYRGGL